MSADPPSVAAPTRASLRAIAKLARAAAAAGEPGYAELATLCRSIEMSGAARTRSRRLQERPALPQPDPEKVRRSLERHEELYGPTCRQAVERNIADGFHPADTVLPQPPSPQAPLRAKALRIVLDNIGWPTEVGLVDRRTAALASLLPSPAPILTHRRGYACGMLLDRPGVGPQAALTISAAREGRARRRAQEWALGLVGRAFAGNAKRDPRIVKPGATRVTQDARARQMNGQMRRCKALERARAAREDRIQCAAQVLDMLAEIGIHVEGAEL